MGKASTRVQNRHIAKAHDRINLTVPKGKKDIIQAHAEAQGQSVNGFINAAIDEKMEKPPTSPVEAPTMHDGAGGWFSLLPPRTLKAAQETAKAAGEDVPQFLDRAVSTQAQRDKMALHMGVRPGYRGQTGKGGVILWHYQ